MGKVADYLVLQPGSEVVPGYRLVRLLGQGGFGEVWEAKAPGDFPVALKFIRLDQGAARPELRSLQILRTIRHPNMLDVQWAVEKADRLVIAMPLCDQSLHDRYQECVKQGLSGIPREELLGYMREAARALDFLNEGRHTTADGCRVAVQHRDIKPHNIFLTGGAARVADFGLAKIVNETLASHSGPMTPQYAPPEFFHDQVTSTSDQYSLAVTFCQLQSGRIPFSGSLHNVINAILHEEPDLRPLPEEDRPVVARALAKLPQQRWKTCQEFVERLEKKAPAAVAPRASCLQTMATEVRGRTLQLLEGARSSELTWAPAGTSNHILWHAGALPLGSGCPLCPFAHRQERTACRVGHKVRDGLPAGPAERTLAEQRRVAAPARDSVASTHRVAPLGWRRRPRQSAAVSSPRRFADPGTEHPAWAARRSQPPG